MNSSKYFTHFIEHPWRTLAICVLVFAVFSIGLPRLAVQDVDFRHHFNHDDTRLVALDALEDVYAITDSVFVAAAPNTGDVFTQKSLAVMEHLTAQLWLTPFATRVESLTNYNHSEANDDELIVNALVKDAEALSDSELNRIKKVALDTQEVAGRLISKDGKVAAFSVSFALPEANREAYKQDVVDQLYATVYEFRDLYPDHEFHLTGELLLNRAVRDALNEDFGILGPVSLLVMLVVALVLLRSAWGTLAVILMVIAVVPASLGFAGWTGMKFYAESGAAVFVLMAVTVAHCVHVMEGVFGRLRAGLERKAAIIESLEMNVWPVFLTSLTTAIGFLSLNFSEMPPFRVMGNIVAVGAMLAFFFSVTLLPLLLSIMPLRTKARTVAKVSIFDHLGTFVVNNRTVLLITSIVVVGTLLTGVPKNDLDDNHLELLDESYEFRRSTDFVSEKFAGLEPFEYSLMAINDGGVTDVEYLQQVESFAQWYRMQPEVVHVFAITDIIKRLNENLNGDDASFYSLPDDSDLAAQYLLLYEFSLPAGLDLNNLVDVDRTSTRMTAILRALTTNEKIALDHRAQKWLDENAPALTSGATGVAIVGAYSIHRNIILMLLGTMTAMAIVSLVLMFVFKSLRFGLISLIPNFIPAAMAMGIWGYTVGYIGVSAAVVTAIAFGIIVDDTIHIMTKYLRARRSGRSSADAIQYSLRNVGKALVSTTLIFALGFLVFSASGMANNQDLGALMVITVIIALIADFLFLPPLLMWLDRDKTSSTKQAA